MPAGFFRKFLLLFIISLIISYDFVCNAEIIHDPSLFTEEFNQLKRNLLDIEDSLQNINREINQINENLTISLIKKTSRMEIKFLEISLEENLWYRQAFDRQDNVYLNNNPTGKNLKKLFWEKGKANLNIKCFYTVTNTPSGPSPKKNEEKEEFVLNKSFKINTETKISNLLSIIISEKKEFKGAVKDGFDLDINFW